MGISHLLNLEALIVFEGGWVIFPPNNHPVILANKAADLEFYFPSDISKLSKLKRITIHKPINQLPTEVSDISSLEVLEIMYANILDFHLEVQKISKIRHLKQLIVHQEYLNESEIESFKKEFNDVLFFK